MKIKTNLREPIPFYGNQWDLWDSIWMRMRGNGNLWNPIPVSDKQCKSTKNNANPLRASRIDVSRCKSIRTNICENQCKFLKPNSSLRESTKPFENSWKSCKARETNHQCLLPPIVWRIMSSLRNSWTLNRTYTMFGKVLKPLNFFFSTRIVKYMHIPFARSLTIRRQHWSEPNKT